MVGDHLDGAKKPKINMELNASGTPASYNVHIKAPLEPDGDTQTQVDGLWI